MAPLLADLGKMSSHVGRSPTARKLGCSLLPLLFFFLCERMVGPIGSIPARYWPRVSGDYAGGVLEGRCLWMAAHF